VLPVTLDSPFLIFIFSSFSGIVLPVTLDSPFLIMPEKEDKTNIKNGESRVTGNTMPEKEDQTNIKNGES
jgi:hypothetical protein